jgi:hypothetical protein
MIKISLGWVLLYPYKNDTILLARYIVKTYLNLILKAHLLFVLCQKLLNFTILNCMLIF